MGAAIMKIETRDLHPTKEQLKLYEKLLKETTMSKKQVQEFEKVNKWMGKWKV